VFKFAENLFETLFQGQGSAPAGGGRVGQPPPRKADAAAAPGAAQPGLIGPPVDLFGVVDAPEAQPASVDPANAKQVQAKPSEVLDAVGVGTARPMSSEHANGLLAEIGGTDKKLKSKFFTGGRESSPDPSYDAEEIAEGKAAGKYVFDSAAQGEVRPYEGQQGDQVSSYSAGKEGEKPVIRVATGERAIAVVPEGADPRMVSTDFSHCGGTVVRGKDAQGNVVLMVGHVSHQDEKGHYNRLQEDIAELKARGITDLQAIVVPGGDPENGPAIPGKDELAENKKLEGVDVTVVPRPDGTDKAAHLVVTKEGVAVFAGELKGDEAKLVASQTFAVEKTFAEHADEGAKPYLAGMEKALASTPEGDKILKQLASKGGSGVRITTERGKGSFRDGDRINIDPESAGDNWRKMAGELVEQMHIEEPKGNTPEERAASAARNAAEARVARIEHTLDEGFGPDAKLPGSREYEAAVAAAIAAGATEEQAKSAGVNAVSAVLQPTQARR